MNKMSMELASYPPRSRQLSVSKWGPLLDTYNVQLPGVAHRTDGGLFHIFSMCGCVCAHHLLSHTKTRAYGQKQSASNSRRGKKSIEQYCGHPPGHWGNSRPSSPKMAKHSSRFPLCRRAVSAWAQKSPLLQSAEMYGPLQSRKPPPTTTSCNYPFFQPSARHFGEHRSTDPVSLTWQPTRNGHQGRH